MSPTRSFRLVHFLSIVLILVLLVIYLLTLLHGPGDHPDTAKFQFAGHVLGTPHAPGYPTYMVLTHFLGKIFPWGTLAYKINLLSAIFSIGTCWTLFYILRLLEVSDVIAFVVALTFGLTGTFWSQAIIAEVYALNALFVALTVYFFVRWNLTRQDRYLLYACAVYAFSFGHHLTMVTLLPAIIFLVIATDKRVFMRPRLVLPILLFIALSASQYYYSIWRYNDPTTVYLDMQTPNLERLVYAVTGGHFKSQMFDFRFSQVLKKRIPMFLKLLWSEYLFLIPLMVCGIFRFKNRTLQVFLLLAIAGNVFWALNYDIPDIYVYFIPSYLLLAIYAGIGLQGVLQPAGTWVRLTAAGAIPLLFLFSNYTEVDQSRNTAGEQARALLNSAGSNAVVFGRGRELPKMYLFYYLYGEEMYKRQLYAVRFDRFFLMHYLFGKGPYHIRELRKNVPPGLTLYCTTALQKTALENLGFEMKRVGPEVFRVIPTANVHPPSRSKLSTEEEEGD